MDEDNQLSRNNPIIFDKRCQILFNSGLFFERHKFKSIKASSLGIPARSTILKNVSSDGVAFSLRNCDITHFVTPISRARLLYPFNP